MYKEIQRTLPWWVYLVTIGLSLAALLFCIYLIRKSSTIGEMQVSVLGSVLIILIPVIIVILVMSIRLETLISSEGVSFRFFPFQMKMRHIHWTEVTNAAVRKYRPLAEFGGWGIRFNVRYKETVYTISGNMGLELELKSGRKILLGTQKPGKIEEVLDIYFRKPERN